MKHLKDFPYVYTLLDGAFSSNSGGRADPNEVVTEVARYEKAEAELMGFCKDLDWCRWLGMQADDGYTVTMITQDGDGGDGPTKEMEAFTILTERY